MYIVSIGEIDGNYIHIQRSTASQKKNSNVYLLNHFQMAENLKK